MTRLLIEDIISAVPRKQYILTVAGVGALLNSIHNFRIIPEVVG
jgi:hypothetical protein